ncbi:MAG: DUF814 domain-containing protein [Melioribacteraceae bacterium]|nr:DUF814 domain-containing protein [Melioribacteraceae bacterium]
MFKDYHYLLRCVLELNIELRGQLIIEAFSQERDIICFHVPDSQNENKHLLISCNPQLPYLYIRKNFRKAKKNAVNFFKKYLPAKINDIRISDSDRIVNISTSSGDFFITIRGSKTNLIFTNSYELDSFLKSENIGSIYKEIIANNYITSAEELEIPVNIISTQPEFREARKNIPYLSRKLYNEIQARFTKNVYAENIISECIRDILESDIAVFYNEDSDQWDFVPVTFNISEKDYEIFQNYNSALGFLISNIFKSDKLQALKKILRIKVTKEIEGLSSKLNKLKERLDNGSKEDLYYKYGNLIINNLHDLKSGMGSIILNDYSTGKNIEIQLDQKLNPAENANKYFEKAKDEKKNYAHSQELYNLSRDKFDFLSRLSEEIDCISDLDQLLNIKKRLNIKTDSMKNKMELSISYYEYIVDDKFHVFVGKDSKSNDLLTTRFAKQNDYWFHARGLPGSHVVLRVDNTKEGVPKNVLIKAASLAAFYSKAKTAGLSPVSYTLKKFVRKNKNMNPGQVLLMKENVLLVKPEIPKNTRLADEVK